MTGLSGHSSCIEGFPEVCQPTRDEDHANTTERGMSRRYSNAKAGDHDLFMLKVEGEQQRRHDQPRQRRRQNEQRSD